VYIFDILKGGSMMFLGVNETQRGLKSVLENKKIMKLIHDCRNDWDSLLYQYKVRLYNFIDTQEAYFIFKLFYFQEISLPISLLKFIEMICNTKLEYKSKFKTTMSSDPEMWGKRPLDEEQLLYASEDVLYLIKAWLNLQEKFNHNLKEIICFLTILKVVDFQVFNQFKDYLISNVIYFSMLEKVFDSNEVYSYIFSVDYIYNFLQIKLISEQNQKEKNEEREHLENNEVSQTILKQGLCFKQKQRLLAFSSNFSNWERNSKSKNDTWEKRLNGKYKDPENITINYQYYQSYDNKGFNKNQNFSRSNKSFYFNKYKNRNFNPNKNTTTNIEMNNEVQAKGENDIVEVNNTDADINRNKSQNRGKRYNDKRNSNQQVKEQSVFFDKRKTSI
jgi:hypothetical protein